MEQALSQLLNTDVQITQSESLGGGCISEVKSVTAQPIGGGWNDSLRSFRTSPVRLVVKRNRADMISNFRCEADGLQAVANAGRIATPEVYAVGEFGGDAYLVLSEIEQSNRSTKEAFSCFGQRLAQWHRDTQGAAIGWHCDNYLGSARQLNESSDNWVDFFADRRIGFQIRWAVDQGYASRRLREDCDQITLRMGDLLSGREETTSLLHGDLWSGNYLFSDSGDPVLIDPAVYRGCREAEWGMIRLFGGCPSSFENAYQQEWEMPSGWQRRVQVYVLYHLLNHLNLFGSSYSSQCEQTAKSILQS